MWQVLANCRRRESECASETFIAPLFTSGRCSTVNRERISFKALCVSQSLMILNPCLVNFTAKIISLDNRQANLIQECRKNSSRFKMKRHLIPLYVFAQRKIFSFHTNFSVECFSLIKCNGEKTAVK